MNLTTICRYGIRAMIELANRYGEEPIPLRAIAEEQHISRKYLDHIMRLLKNAGLVRVVKGVRGGFQLSRPSAEIKVSEIFHVLEGDSFLVECVSDMGICDRSDNCAARNVWAELSRRMEEFLSSKTLADLAVETSAGYGGRSEAPSHERRGTRKPSRSRKG
jgi:Rrf2 family cysteine metabolism transcriptional repressor